MEAWLSQFLADEQRSGVWRIREPDGFPTWAYFRPRAAQCRYRRAHAIAEPFHAPHTLRHYLGGQLAPRARALCKLPLAARHAFDAVFFTNFNLATPSPTGPELMDRIHEGYFRLCSNPLILQSPYHGQYARYPRWAENIYCSATWTIVMRRLFEWRGTLRPLHATDEPACNAMAAMFGGGCSGNQVGAMLKRMRGARAFYELFVGRVLVPRMQRRLAFVNFACGLGQEAMLTFALHQNGFLVAEAQHGIITRNVVDYQYPADLDPALARGVLPDLLLALGRESCRSMSPLLESRPVGHYYLNQIAGKPQTAAAPRRADMLVLSQGGASRRMGEIALGLARAFPDRRVLLKLHPTEQTCRQLLTRFEALPNASVTRGDNVYLLMRDTPVLVGYFSLALLEGAVFPGKRIYLLNNNFLPADLGYYFQDLDDLVQAIRSGEQGIPALDAAEHFHPEWDQAARGVLDEINRRLEQDFRRTASTTARSNRGSGHRTAA